MDEWMVQPPHAGLEDGKTVTYRWMLTGGMLRWMNMREHKGR